MAVQSDPEVWANKTRVHVVECSKAKKLYLRCALQKVALKFACSFGASVSKEVSQNVKPL